MDGEKCKRVGKFSTNEISLPLRKRVRADAVPAGRFQRRVNYLTPARVRSGKGVKEKKKKDEIRRAGRAAHVKRELNVEISVSPQRARYDQDDWSSSAYFSFSLLPPPPPPPATAPKVHRVPAGLDFSRAFGVRSILREYLSLSLCAG